MKYILQFRRSFVLFMDIIITINVNAPFFMSLKIETESYCSISFKLFSLEVEFIEQYIKQLGDKQCEHILISGLTNTLLQVVYL